MAPGDKYGRLKIVEHRDGGRWLCECECGGTVLAHRTNLQRGRTRSCGCLRRETSAERGRSSATHGLSRSPTYRSWQSAVQRVTNSNHAKWEYWGGRGITMCDRWLGSFSAFLEDMGERPPGTTLDRIDNDGNYEPGNCRWAPADQQNQNRRKGEQ